MNGESKLDFAAANETEVDEHGVSTAVLAKRNTKHVIAGDNVDCWMEIQHGKGPWANPVSGIVPLGTTLTMVIGINDKQGKKTWYTLFSYHQTMHCTHSN